MKRPCISVENKVQTSKAVFRNNFLPTVLATQNIREGGYHGIGRGNTKISGPEAALTITSIYSEQRYHSLLGAPYHYHSKYLDRYSKRGSKTEVIFCYSSPP